jgi:uracil-DNA glycosylase
MTAKEGARKRSGSGFISRNNNDESAKATFEFMRRAGLPRKMTIIWNVVPWWNGTRKVTSFELREGAESVKQLIKLLPKLRAVVFVGQSAAKARPYLTDSGLALFSSAHPSPLVRASWPERWRAIPSDWAKVKPVLGLP